MAAKDFKAEVVKDLIARGAPVNALNQKRKTPLLAAVKRATVLGGYKKTPDAFMNTMRALVEGGKCNVDQEDKDNCTPLQYALMSSHAEISKYLLNHGASVRATGGNTGKTMIALCIENNQAEALQPLFDAARRQGMLESMVNDTTKDGKAPIHLAISSNCNDALPELLACDGIDVNKVDRQGNTALHLALKNKNVAAVDSLVLLGRADVNIRDAKGKTAVDLGNEWGDPHVKDVLAMAGSGSLFKTFDARGYAPIHTAVAARNLPLLKKICDDPECDINLKTQKSPQRTALHLALENKSIPLVDFLVRTKDADVNIPDPGAGSNPPLCSVLAFASKDEARAMTELLLAHHAQVEVKDKSGNTPLILAAKNGDTDTIRLLLEAGASATAKGASGRTALHEALAYADLGLAKLLVEEGKADVEQVDGTGQTALHVAVSTKDNTDVMEYLVKDCKGSVNASDNMQRTPFMIALNNDRLDLLPILLAAHPAPDVNVEDSLGRTPLYIAANASDLKLCQQLVAAGARVDDVCRAGGAALHAAIGVSCVEVVDFLVKKANASVDAENKLQNRPITLALAGGKGAAVTSDGSSYVVQRDVRQNIMTLLVKDGHADVNYVDQSGSAPLHIAVGEMDLPLVELLVKEGKAKPNVTDRAGYSPINMLWKDGKDGYDQGQEFLDLRMAIMSCLVLEAAADVNAADPAGATALHHAAKELDTKLVDLLVLRGKANVDVADRSGDRPMTLAMASAAVGRGFQELPELRLRRLQVFKTLVVDGKGDVLYVDSKGASLMHTAVKELDAALATLLVVEGKGDVNLVDRSLRRPLDSCMETLMAVPPGVATEEVRAVRLAVAGVLVKEGKAEVNFLSPNGRPPLSFAIDEADLALATLFIKDGHADAMLSDAAGRRPLSHALAMKMPDGADPASPLFQNAAARELRLQIAWLLVRDGGARTNYMEPEGHTPIITATKELDVELVELMVKEAAAEVNVRDGANMSPVSYVMRTPAVHSGDLGEEEVRKRRLKIMECLVREGKAQLNFVDPDGKAPLHMAIAEKDVELTKLMVHDGGADVNMENGNKMRPVTVAVDVVQPPPPVAAVAASPTPAKSTTSGLKSVTSGIKSMTSGVKSTGVSAKKSLMSKLTLVTTKPSKDKAHEEPQAVKGSALVGVEEEEGVSVRDVRLALLTTLVADAKAEVSYADPRGNQPLHYLISEMDVAAVALLVTAGKADVNVVNSEMKRPISLALEVTQRYANEDQVQVRASRLETCRIMICEAKPTAEVNFLDEQSCAPLHHATVENDLELVQLLVLKGGADVDVMNSQNETPVLLGTQNQHVDVVKFLVHNKADTNKLNAQQRNCLHKAVELRNVELVQFLIDEGKCNASQADTYGMYPMDLALQGLVTNPMPLPTAANAASIGAIIATISDVIRILVERGHAEVKYRDSRGNSPLHYATQFNMLPLVRLFMEAGSAEVNVQDDNGMTPLFVSVNNKYREITEYLVRVGKADVNILDQNGTSVLHRAVALEDEPVVKLLVVEGHSNVNTISGADATALSVAVETLLCMPPEPKEGTPVKKGHEDDGRRRAVNREMIRFLLAEAHADPNALVYVCINPEDKKGANKRDDQSQAPGDDKKSVASSTRSKMKSVMTAVTSTMHTKKAGKPTDLDKAKLEVKPVLHWAMEACSADLVTMLVQLGHADTNLLDRQDRTVLMLCLQMLLEIVTKPKSFMGMIGSSDKQAEKARTTLVEMAVLLITEGQADVNKPDKAGSVPITMVAKMGSKFVMPVAEAMVLKAPQLDPNAKDQEGNTALHVAVSQQDKELVMLLLKHPTINPNVFDTNGDTPLNIAINKSYLEMADLLAKHPKADLNLSRNPNDRPILQCVRKAPTLVPVLVKSGFVNVNVQDDQNKTPLHYAVEAKDKALVSELVKGGHAFVDVMDSEGMTPLHLAAALGKKEIVEILLEADDNTGRVGLDMRNKEGKTPVHMAITKKGKDIVDLFALRGANLNVQDIQGKAPLHYAAAAELQDVLEILLHRGANHKLRDKASSKMALEYVKSSKVQAWMKAKQDEKPVDNSVLMETGSITVAEVSGMFMPPVLFPAVQEKMVALDSQLAAMAREDPEGRMPRVGDGWWTWDWSPLAPQLDVLGVLLSVIKAATWLCNNSVSSVLFYKAKTARFATRMKNEQIVLQELAMKMSEFMEAGDLGDNTQAGVKTHLQAVFKSLQGCAKLMANWRKGPSGDMPLLKPNFIDTTASSAFDMLDKEVAANLQEVTAALALVPFMRGVVLRSPRDQRWGPENTADLKSDLHQLQTCLLDIGRGENGLKSMVQGEGIKMETLVDKLRAQHADISRLEHLASKPPAPPQTPPQKAPAVAAAAVAATGAAGAAATAAAVSGAEAGAADAQGAAGAAGDVDDDGSEVSVDDVDVAVKDAAAAATPAAVAGTAVAAAASAAAASPEPKTPGTPDHGGAPHAAAAEKDGAAGAAAASGGAFAAAARDEVPSVSDSEGDDGDTSVQASKMSPRGSMVITPPPWMGAKTAPQQPDLDSMTPADTPSPRTSMTLPAATATPTSEGSTPASPEKGPTPVAVKPGAGAGGVGGGDDDDESPARA